jgi:hypothetical protein
MRELLERLTPPKHQSDFEGLCQKCGFFVKKKFGQKKKINRNFFGKKIQKKCF